MSIGLKGINVMVVRPQGQNENLCKLINNSGGKVVRFPTVNIKPVNDISNDILMDLFDWSSHIIFISRNSVRVLMEKMGELKTISNGKIILATGEGTANEAQESGVEQVSYPETHSGSEALLELPELQPVSIDEKNVVIVRGDTGRELLKDELESRGAIVKYANVYTRETPDVSTEFVDSIWSNNPPDMIVITSNQGLFNLIKMTPEKYQDKLFSTDLIAMSERIAVTASGQGFIKKPVIAEKQSDQGLVSAIYKSLEQPQ